MQRTPGRRYRFEYYVTKRPGNIVAKPSGPPLPRSSSTRACRHILLYFFNITIGLYFLFHFIFFFLLCFARGHTSPPVYMRKKKNDSDRRKRINFHRRAGVLHPKTGSVRRPVLSAATDPTDICLGRRHVRFGIFAFFFFPRFLLRKRRHA